ncbi:MAG: hypothetical protein KDA79_07730 [Planctomycetaceae bacterium]|nr:hypothetical protein [Planctomycetaceae bacterium]
MNATLLCCAALVAAVPTGETSPSVYRPSPVFQMAIRGQTPTFDSLPAPGEPQPSYQAPADSFGYPGNGYPADGSFMTPGQAAPPGPLNYDPFLSGVGVPPSPYAGSGGYSFGANGPQPYRLGWTTRMDFGIMPGESAGQGLGDIQIFEFDLDLEHTQQISNGWLFSMTHEFDMRSWDGPTSSRTGPPNLAHAGFPEELYRFGWDLELATPANQGPWSMQLAFNPSINSDLQQSLSSDAWNLDGRAIMFFKTSPYWTWALGAGFWDRVNDRVIPYAGAIWTPDDRWEWRLVFPEPRISYFLGNVWGIASWFYVRGQYHVEAYEVQLKDRTNRSAFFPRQEKMEIEDWRVLAGMRSENGFMTTFIEAGWVFDRKVDFINETSSFDISSGFIARAGIRY